MALSITTQEIALVEQTTLPKITVRGKSNEPQVEAYVNAYVVGHKQELLTNGKLGTPLYYLSLVAGRGQGTSVQAVFARLVNVHSRGATLDGVGEVFLAHHRQYLASCGYTVHWNFEQAEVLPERDLHAIIESNMLTICDPVRAMAVKPRRTRAMGGGKPREKARASLSTAKGGKMQTGIEEVRNRERHPLFLLLVPSWSQDALARQMQHFSFLDPRVPWPLDPSWAAFLWERGLERGEIESLRVWGYTPPAPREEEEADAGEEMNASPAVPFLAEAYLCRPHLASLAQDLTKALRSGRIHTHLARPLTVLPARDPAPLPHPLEPIALVGNR